MTTALEQADAPIDGAIDVAIDVAIIGAGLAGIVCAQQLRQWGYRVISLEKSRGLGGRLATRRLSDTCADHGVRAIFQQGALSQQLIAALVGQQILQPWVKALYAQHADGLAPADTPTYYSAPAGLTAVAKGLAQGLEIQRGQRVVAIAPAAKHWILQLEPAHPGASIDPPHPVTRTSLQAKSLILAIPAPQAAELLASIDPQSTSLTSAFTQLQAQVQSVQFDPCITAIATYAADYQNSLSSLPWQAVQFADSEALAWLSVETEKRASPDLTPVVIQSSASFAAQYLEADNLQTVGQTLLSQAAKLLELSWLNQPIALQVHRWRYALAQTPLQQGYLATIDPLPLICCGDWCGGSQIEAALKSGLAAATQIQTWSGNPVSIPLEAQFEQLLRSIPFT